MGSLLYIAPVFAALDSSEVSAPASVPDNSNAGWIGQPALAVKTPDNVIGSANYNPRRLSNPLPPSLLKKPTDGWLGQPSLVIKPRGLANGTPTQDSAAAISSGIAEPTNKAVDPAITASPNNIIATPLASVPQNGVSTRAVDVSKEAVVSPTPANPIARPVPVAVAIDPVPPQPVTSPVPAKAAAAKAVPDKIDTETPQAAPAIASTPMSTGEAQGASLTPKSKPYAASDVVAFYPKQPLYSPSIQTSADAKKSALANDPEKNGTAGATNPEVPETKISSTPPTAVSIPDKPPTQRELQDGTFIRSLSGRGGLLSLDITRTTKPDIDRPIRMDEAVALALQNNSEVQASEERVDGAKWQKLGSYSQYAPSVEINYASGMETSDPAAINDSFGNRVLDNTHHRRDSSLAVRQPLIDLSIIADILRSHDNESMVQTDLRDVREGTAFDTVSVFMKLTQARIAIKLADQYKSYLDDVSGRMAARVEGGGATGADLDRIKSRSTLAESARIEAVGDYDSNLSEFKRLTHIMPSQLKIPDILVPAVPQDPQEALQQAVISNPAYISSLRKVDIAESGRNKSIADLTPKLSLDYTKTHTFNADGAAEGNPIDGVYPNQNEERVMLVARWALSGGTTIAEGLEGAAKEREMRLRSQDVRARLEQAIRTSYNAINAASRRITILQQAIEADMRVAKDFEDQYKDGTRSLFDLLDAYEHLYTAQLDLMRVTIAKAQASYQIRREMGQLVPAIMDSEVH